MPFRVGGGGGGAYYYPEPLTHQGDGNITPLRGIPAAFADTTLTHECVESFYGTSKCFYNTGKSPKFSAIYFSDIIGALLLIISIVGRATLKMWRRKLKMQFVKQERNTQNAIAFLNYLKSNAPQQLMLRTKVFTKNF
jgi:hypothetical protein